MSSTGQPIPDSKASLAILCGGYSRRFGTDKGLYAPLGDEPLFVRAIRLFGEEWEEILVVLRDLEQEHLYRIALQPYLGQAPFDRVKLIYDHPENSSPCALQGVQTALGATTKEAIIAVPVDQVGVRASHLTSLYKKSQGHGFPVAFLESDQSLLPFPSLWRKLHHPLVTMRLKAQGLSVRGTLKDLSAQWIEAPSWLEALAANVNTRLEAEKFFGRPLIDPYGRHLHYVRFSLTEACNLACQYCLPDGFPEWYRHKARLGIDAIGTLAKGFRLLGFRKIRFTGGEPTVHPKALNAVNLAQDLGYEQIAMTTNGLLLGDLPTWQSAGLTHINFSLDSLDPKIFRDMTGNNDVGRVIASVESALALKLKVKVNTVLMRSKNGSTSNIRELIEWALARPITLRFIELMDTKLNSGFAPRERVYGYEIEKILLEYGLAPLHKEGQKIFLGGPATDYGSMLHQGRIGLINPLSCNFCSACNRLRVTARGHLKLCLFGNHDEPLPLTSPEDVAFKVRQLIGKKPEKHYLEDGLVGNVSTFRTIGG